MSHSSQFSDSSNTTTDNNNTVNNTKPSIAIIGSGIGGLTCCYLLSLSKKYNITIFESEKSLGMGSHALDININNVIYNVDIPLRVYSEKYYPYLTKLYNNNNIISKSEDYSGSFAYKDESSYFSYKNFLYGKISIPYITWNHLFSGYFIIIYFIFTVSTFWNILYQHLYFHHYAPIDLNNNKILNITLIDYLMREKYTLEFINSFFLPIICAICTCSFDAARNYPADIIVEYLTKRFLYGVKRASGGTKEITAKLSANCDKIHLDTKVSSIEYQKCSDKVEVTYSGITETFSDVIVATQAHQALKMIKDPTEEQKNLLSSIKFERSKLVVHKDKNLMPAEESSWRSVNFIINKEEKIGEFPMASIWMNRVGLLPKDSQPIFQTWAPLSTLDLAPENVLSYNNFDRPIVTLESQKCIKDLSNYVQGQNHIWLCGSYYGKGVPLLENAVVSAMNTVKAIQKIDTCELDDEVCFEKKSKFSWFNLSTLLIPIVVAVYFLRK